MAKDLVDLAKFMEKVGAALEKDVREFTGDVAFSVHSAVVGATPVDVGTARSNWIVRLGSPWSMVYRAFSPIPSRWKPPYAAGPGKTETANREGARRQAKGVLASRKGDETIYITNNLPYIARLNSGYSRQSPSGFVQDAVSYGMRDAIRRFRFANVRKVKM